MSFGQKVSDKSSGQIFVRSTHSCRGFPQPRLVGLSMPSDNDKRGRTSGGYSGGLINIQPCQTSNPEAQSEDSNSKNKYPQTQRKCDVARRKRRMSAGLCVTCGKAEFALGKTRCSPCQDKHNLATSITRTRWREQGLCRDCGSHPVVVGFQRCSTCMATRRVHARRHNKDIRMQILEHYGASCACCGEQQVLFLDVDHIDNNGAEHRRSISHEGFSGTTFYRWLVRNHFPDGFQLLCRNCNWGKHRNGGVCPHKEVIDG